MAHLTEVAWWRPNLMCALHLRVNDTDVVASQDFMAANHERRHFIDRDFLLTLPNGAELLRGVVAPVPVCREFGGIDPPCRVLGMLPRGLLATYWSPANDAWERPTAAVATEEELAIAAYEAWRRNNFGLMHLSTDEEQEADIAARTEGLREAQFAKAAQHTKQSVDLGGVVVIVGLYKLNAVPMA
jgi:hypothetical protein